MDRGRRDHVLNAVREYVSRREEIWMDPASSSLQNVEGTLKRLEDLERSSVELRVAATFGREYLKSLIIPPSCKFVMWLTLQNDVYFRGGRAASERLSAARIGERVRKAGFFFTFCPLFLSLNTSCCIVLHPLDAELWKQ